MANGTGIALTTTGIAGLGATQIEPLIKWFIDGCPAPVPDPVVGIMAVGVLMAVHILQKLISRLIGDKDGDGLPDVIEPAATVVPAAAPIPAPAPAPAA